MIVNHSVSIILLVLLLIVHFPTLSLATWNFSAVNLPNDVPIWRFAIWRNRAFFALPGFTKRDKHLESELTLLEARWPEPGSNQGGFITTLDDNDVRVFSKSSIGTDVCQRLTSVVGLDIDSRGRLWVLDSSAYVHCPAKIIIYDLRRNDVEVVRSDFPDLAKNNLKTLVIDPVLGIRGLCAYIGDPGNKLLTCNERKVYVERKLLEVVRSDFQGLAKNNLKTLVIDPVLGIWGPRAYIGDPGDGSIIVYNLFKKKWWRLRLVGDIGIPRFSSTEMAISRKNSLLYLTDSQSSDLFSIDIENLRNEAALSLFLDNEISSNTTIKWLGRKMGRSSGLAIDQKGGLHYFLVTEHASLRWDTKQDLKASSYTVLLQSEQVPCITDYRLDNQRNVWGLVNLENPIVKTSSSIFRDKWNGQFRTIRIFKHNSLTP